MSAGCASVMCRDGVCEEHQVLVQIDGPEGCRGDLTIHLVTASVCRSPQTAAVPALSSLCLRHKSENKTREINGKFNMKTQSAVQCICEHQHV